MSNICGFLAKRKKHNLFSKTCLYKEYCGTEMTNLSFSFLLIIYKVNNYLRHQPLIERGSIIKQSNNRMHIEIICQL